jgi:hypothetical protein
MRNVYRTPKGTELPIMNLRGKEYLEVKYRLVWFREEHPDWAIETELLSVTEDSAYCRAVIKDGNGRVIATSHKFENKKGFADFIEKSETGSIGRALALIGFGTQFCADELDEGERIVDSPTIPAVPQHEPEVPPWMNEPWPDEAMQTPQPKGEQQDDPGEYKVTFGAKFKGKKLKEIGKPDIESYIHWLEDNAAKKGLPLSAEARFLKVAVGRYHQHLQKRAANDPKQGTGA